MIHIGLHHAYKAAVVDAYIREHGCKKIFVISPDRFAPSFATTRMDEPEKQCDGRAGVFVPYDRVQWYRWFYKLLAEIDGSSLVVVNECLRSQKRTGDLDLNCIRNFLNQTPHKLVFQWLPIIDTIEDFMILFDLDTKSQWKREPFRQELVQHCKLAIHNSPPALSFAHVDVDAKLLAEYAKQKTKIVAEVKGDVDKDPHMIPRQLLLVSGKAKLAHVDSGKLYVGRNNRFKLPNLATFRDVVGTDERVVFEFPTHVSDICDLVSTTHQSSVTVLVADTKVERWYEGAYIAWQKRMSDAYATLQQCISS
jgi:hypothetical protein